MAEREGFEPPVRLHVLRISSAARSTTLPPLRRACVGWESGARVGAAISMEGGAGASVRRCGCGRRRGRRRGGGRRGGGRGGGGGGGEGGAVPAPGDRRGPQGGREELRGGARHDEEGDVAPGGV